MPLTVNSDGSLPMIMGTDGRPYLNPEVEQQINSGNGTAPPPGTATPGTEGSWPLAPATATTFGQLSSFYSPIGFNTALSVVAATTAHKFSCTRW